MSNLILSKISKTIFNFLSSKDKYRRSRDVDDEIAVRITDSVVRYESVERTGVFVERDADDQVYIKELMQEEADKENSKTIRELLLEEENVFAINDSDVDRFEQVEVVTS